MIRQYIKILLTVSFGFFLCLFQSGNDSAYGEGIVIKPAFRPLNDQNIHQPQGIYFPNQKSKDNLPASEDLSETMEVQFTQEIIDLANNLNNSPIAIYRYVKSSIEYQPYYGSLKGSQETLLQRGGNDLDIASLLIALFRSPNVQVPCRYAGSYVKFDASDVLKWLSVDDIYIAIDILNDAGILAVLEDNDTKVSLVHYWVHAYLPYGNYRGIAQDQTEKTWIPLDASFKKWEVTEGFLYSGELIFNTQMKDNYYDEIRNISPTTYYLDELQEYLDQSHPGILLEELKRKKSISSDMLEFLPIELPYWVNQLQLQEGPELSDYYRYKVNFRVTEGGITQLDQEITFPEDYAKKLTISFLPATQADENIINSYGGYYNTPPGEILVKPVLKVNGNSVAEGDSILPGTDLYLYLNFTLPGLFPETVLHNINSGGFYSFAFEPVGDMDHHIAQRQDLFQITTQSSYDYYSDEFLGELFYISAIKYFNEFEKSSLNLSDVIQHYYNKGLSEIMVGQNVITVEETGVPVEMKPSGYLIDVKRHVFNYYSPVGNQSRNRELFSIEAMTGSFYQHWVLDNTGGLGGVSTVKALQIARNQGLLLYEITNDDIGSGGLLETLNISQTFKDKISDEINSDDVGTENDLIITVPEDEINFNQWNGLAWTSYDPEINYDNFNLFSSSETNKNVGAMTTISSGSGECPENENCAPNVIILWPPNESLHCINSPFEAFAFYWDMSGGANIPYSLNWTSNIPGAPQNITDETYTVSSSYIGDYTIQVSASNAFGYDSDQNKISLGEFELIAPAIMCTNEVSKIAYFADPGCDIKWDIVQDTTGGAFVLYYTISGYQLKTGEWEGNVLVSGALTKNDATFCSDYLGVMVKKYPPATTYPDDFPYWLSDLCRQHKQLCYICTENFGDFFDCYSELEDLRDEAYEFSNLEAPDPYDQLPDGKTDAIRHTYWSCIMKHKFGSSLAHSISDAHESDSPNKCCAGIMDILNNEKGREIDTLSCTDLDDFSCCQNTVRSLISQPDSPIIWFDGGSCNENPLHQ